MEESKLTRTLGSALWPTWQNPCNNLLSQIIKEDSAMRKNVYLIRTPLKQLRPDSTIGVRDLDKPDYNLLCTVVMVDKGVIHAVPKHKAGEPITFDWDKGNSINPAGMEIFLTENRRKGEEWIEEGRRSNDLSWK